MNDLVHRSAGENWYLAMEKAVNFALALGAWDGPEQRADLQKLMARLTDQYANAGGREISKRTGLIGLIISLTLRRGSDAN